MADDLDPDADWTTDLPLGDDGARTSTRRQVAMITAIVVATIVLLTGLVAAGAAVLNVVGDRATQHTASYDFGHDFAERARDVVTNVNQPQDWDETCRLLIDQLTPADGAPEPFTRSEAVAGCVDALSS